MKISNFFLSTTFCFLYLILFYQPRTLAEEKPSVHFKLWSELSNEEKISLRARWTKERVNKVVNSLKNGKGFPDFVKKIPLSEEDLKIIKIYRTHIE
jgi:hypothetical protein